MALELKNTPTNDLSEQYYVEPEIRRYPGFREEFSEKFLTKGVHRPYVCPSEKPLLLSEIGVGRIRCYEFNKLSLYLLTHLRGGSI